jgi:hypothetical protein
LLIDVHDPSACFIIKDLLSKTFSSRMTFDIYSLGLLFWEIAWCKAGNLPFKKIPTKIFIIIYKK